MKEKFDFNKWLEPDEMERFVLANFYPGKSTSLKLEIRRQVKEAGKWIRDSKKRG